MALQQSPYILYSDGKGNIFEDTSLYTAGRSGWDAYPIPEEEWIELPEGGSLYELPGRRGIGIDVRTGEMRLCEKGWAVAAFIPPAHTGLWIAAYETGPDAPTLPLFCYTAAGWLDQKFYVPAVRIEQPAGLLGLVLQDRALRAAFARAIAARRCRRGSRCSSGRGCSCTGTARWPGAHNRGTRPCVPDARPTPSWSNGRADSRTRSAGE